MHRHALVWFTNLRYRLTAPFVAAYSSVVLNLDSKSVTRRIHGMYHVFFVLDMLMMTA